VCVPTALCARVLVFLGRHQYTSFIILISDCFYVYRRFRCITLYQRNKQCFRATMTVTCQVAYC
jgi:hypothetical protein